jgi:hypothetical protein
VAFILINNHIQDAAVYWQRRMLAHIREIRTIQQRNDKVASIKESYDKTCYELDWMACVISKFANGIIFGFWLLQYFFTDKPCWIDNSSPVCQRELNS